MKYTFKFRGRQRNAIGVFYYINFETEADTPKDALNKVYDLYELEGNLAMIDAKGKNYTFEELRK